MLEWDRKATRAHVRKLGVNVKEGNTKKPRAGEKERGGAEVDKKEFPTLSRGIEGDGEDEDDTEKEDGEGESGDERGSGGQFSRRKMHNNSWRYEQEEEELVPGEGKYFNILPTKNTLVLMEHRAGRDRAGTGLCCHDEGAKRPTGET